MTLTVEQLMAVQEPRLTVPGLFIPEGFDRRPYQLIDALFILLRKRCIVAEVPGSGKKLITVMAVLKAFSMMKARSALVVSLGTDVDQWAEDLQLLAPECTVQVYRGSPRDRRFMRSVDPPDFRITTYQTAAADTEHLFGQHEFIVLDEVSYLKNPDTDAHKHLR